MTIAVVTGPTNIPGSTSGNTSAAVDTTGADCCIITTGAYITTDPTVSDSQGNTYTGGTNYKSNQGQSRIWYKANPTVGSGHTASTVGSNIEGTGVFFSLSGVHATPLDQQSGANPTGGATTLQPAASITPSEDNCFVITCAAHWNNAITVDTPFSSNQYNSTFATAQWTGCLEGYEIQTTATARRPTFTAATNQVKACAIASFKAAGGVATTVARLVNSGLLHGGMLTNGGRLVRQAA